MRAGITGVRRGGDDRRPCTLQPLGEGAHEEQIGELALPVGTPCAVLALAHEVVEVHAPHPVRLR